MLVLLFVRDLMMLCSVCVAIVAKSKEEPTCASSTGVAEPNVPRVIFLQLLSAASSVR